MRGKSSRQVTQVEREKPKNNLDHNPKQEPHLSGAYIRSLVKQLTSSKVKDPMNPNTLQKLTKCGEVASDQGKLLVPPQHKKQVRRRLHTTRPYQERLLNMAEARKEIVTALKSHRASMKKQANEQENSNFEPNSDPLPEEKVKSRRNSRTNPPKETMKYPINQSNVSTFYPYSYWPGIQVANYPDNLNFALPSQPLGLNLNFQELTFYQNTNNINSPSVYSSSESNLVSSGGEFTNVIAKTDLGSEGESSGLGLHQVMDEEKMAEIKSLGVQHEVEWDDNVNLVKSAWWFKYMKNSEEEQGCTYSHLDDEVAQFPEWLDAGSSPSLEQDYVFDKYFHDCLQDPALPCMDIGEFEGIDEEWLA